MEIDPVRGEPALSLASYSPTKIILDSTSTPASRLVPTFNNRSSLSPPLSEPIVLALSVKWRGSSVWFTFQVFLSSSNPPPWIHNLHKHKEDLKLEDKRMFSLSPVSSSRLRDLREGNLYSPGSTTGSGAGSHISGRANKKRKKVHSSAIQDSPLSYLTS